MASDEIGVRKSQKISLLSQNNMPGYCTIGPEDKRQLRPKLAIVIPPNKRPRPILVSGDYGDVIVDIHQLSRLNSVSSCGYL